MRSEELNLLEPTCLSIKFRFTAPIKPSTADAVPLPYKGGFVLPIE